MFIVNRLDTSRIVIIAKALGLAAICAVCLVATVYVAPVIIAALAAIIATALGIVAAVVTVIAHAATYAVAMLLAVAVRVVIFTALSMVLPAVWHLCRWLWAHRQGVTVAGKGLALGCLVVGVFVGALMVAPMVLAALPTVGTVAGVFGGFLAVGKVM